MGANLKSEKPVAPTIKTSSQQSDSRRPPDSTAQSYNTVHQPSYTNSAVNAAAKDLLKEEIGNMLSRSTPS